MTNESRARERREFLRMIGAAVGGAVLLPYGCGGSGGDGVSTPPLPNGYRFFKVFGAGQNVLKGVGAPTPGVMINDKGRIVFYAQGAGESAYALCELTLDYDKDPPEVEYARVVVATGQSVDGRPVERILRADTNGDGSIAALIDFRHDAQPTPESLAGVYLDRGSGLQRIVGFGDAAPDGGRFGGAFGDLALHKDDEFLLVAHFADAEGEPVQGLFSLRGPDASSAQVQLRTGTALQGRESAIVSSLGLVDLHDGGHFTVQARARPRAWFQGSAAQGAPSQAVLVQGRTAKAGATADVQVLSAPREAALEAPVAGDVILGPRAGARESAAWVTHMPTAEGAESDQRLFLRQSGKVTEVVRAGGGDAPIYSLSAPVLSANGQLFFLHFNRNGSPAMVLNVVGPGGPQRILATGDAVGGRKITGLMHGYHSRQADAAGRIVAYVEFEGGEPALVLGIPV